MLIDLEKIVQRAGSGEVKALDQLVRYCQSKLHPLVIRMVVDPDLAEDATQEILIRIITNLSSFRSESKFDTWAYRIAMNYLLNAKRVKQNDPQLNFNIFSEDLASGLVDDKTVAPDDHIMLNEIRIKCTMAMMMCLDQEQRAAYVLGEILEFDHKQASEILEITPSNFRKRLSRARADVIEFTSAACGLSNPLASCTCQRRLPIAQKLGRVGKEPSAMFASAPDYQSVRRQCDEMNKELIAAKLQQSVGLLQSEKDFASEILGMLDPP